MHFESHDLEAVVRKKDPAGSPVVRAITLRWQGGAEYQDFVRALTRFADVGDFGAYFSATNASISTSVLHAHDGANYPGILAHG